MSFLLSLIMVWQNAIYFGPMVFSLFYLAVFWLGFDSTSSVETEAEIEADIDTDLEIETDVEVDTDLDTDIEVEADTGIQARPSMFSHGVVHDALSFLGVGRCPFSIILIALSLLWGFFGLSFNALFSKFVPLGLYILPSSLCAGISSLISTRFISMFVAKHLSQGTTAVKLESLVGHHGKASMKIDTSLGRATVRDRFNTLHNIDCRIQNNERPIPAGKDVLVLQYLPKRKIFIVREKPELLRLQKKEEEGQVNGERQKRSIRKSR